MSSRLEIADYIRIIGMVQEVPVDKILSPSRIERVVDCRRLICLVCADRGFPIPEIAKELQRDRSSIYYMLEIGRFRIKYYAGYRQQLEEIKRRLA